MVILPEIYVCGIFQLFLLRSKKGTAFFKFQAVFILRRKCSVIKVKRTVALVCIASVLILNGCDKRIPLYDKLAVAPVIQVSEQKRPEYGGWARRK